MKESPNKSGKRTVALFVGGTLLVAWLWALVPVIRDNFFSQRTPPAGGLQEDSLQMAGGLSVRHNILDRRHEELAVSFRMNSVYAKPLEMTDPEKGVEFLSEALGLDKKNLLRDLKAERSFVWLGRHISAEKTAAVQTKNLPGVYIINELQRYYPFHQTASHTLGFLKDGHGLAGVESYYDSILRDTEEPVASSTPGEEIKGHLVLALDIKVQELLEHQLGTVMSEVDAGSAIGLVMRPSTGAILAMSSIPTYDPNLFWDFGAIERRNLAVNDPLDIGGFNRLFRLAASFEAENAIKMAKEVQPESLESLRRSLKSEQSPRVSKVQRGYFADGADQLVSTELSWPEDFKLSAAEELAFKKIVGLIGESKVDLPVVNSVSSLVPEKDLVNGFPGVNEPGQVANAINLLAAFSRIVNDGSPITPHIAVGIQGANSGKTAKLRHEKDSGVLLPETSRRLRAFLAGFAKTKGGPVFIEAFHKNESLAVDDIAAQEEDLIVAEGDKLNPDTKQSATAGPPRYQTTLMGFAPADIPDLTMLIVLKDAVVGQDKTSPMRAMAEKNISLIRKLANEDLSTEQKKRNSLSYAKAYQEWLESQTGQKKLAAVSSGEEQSLMPDLRGMSLRKALQVIQPLGLKVRINGSGSVISQDPGPGKKINRELCVIQLKEGLA